MVIFVGILVSLFVTLIVPGNNVIAYYGLSGVSSPNGGLYGGYGLYGGGLYGMYGGYGGLYGGYGLYGGGLYGMYGGYGLYGGGLYGMYGGYGGIVDLGLTNLSNPLNYYSYGGMYNLLNNFDPLGDPLLGLGMFSFASCST
jgi:hypothetical protein